MLMECACLDDADWILFSPLTRIITDVAVGIQLAAKSMQKVTTNIVPRFFQFEHCPIRAPC